MSCASMQTLLPVPSLKQFIVVMEKLISKAGGDYRKLHKSCGEIGVNLRQV